MKVCKNNQTVRTCYKVFCNQISLTVNLCTICLIDISTGSHLKCCSRQFLYFISKVTSIPSGKYLTFLVNSQCSKLLLISCSKGCCLTCLNSKCVYLSANHITLRSLNLLYIISACHKCLGSSCTITSGSNCVNLIGARTVSIDTILCTGKLHTTLLVLLGNLSITDILSLNLEIR